MVGSGSALYEEFWYHGHTCLVNLSISVLWGTAFRCVSTVQIKKEQ